ncbi:unnamed protein product [Enterobius vermicularis]|uniref:Ovule protein n=1 Tax=Enterobius vermicularis TaxID=51028 RepID=A0A0N4V1L1_ENTVE|nr:unnamed protein product [Enterobius vermicularis]
MYQFLNPLDSYLIFSSPSSSLTVYYERIQGPEGGGREAEEEREGQGESILNMSLENCQSSIDVQFSENDEMIPSG